MCICTNIPKLIYTKFRLIPLSLVCVCVGWAINVYGLLTIIHTSVICAYNLAKLYSMIELFVLWAVKTCCHNLRYIILTAVISLEKYKPHQQRQTEENSSKYNCYITRGANTLYVFSVHSAWWKNHQEIVCGIFFKMFMFFLVSVSLIRFLR